MTLCALYSNASSCIRRMAVAILVPTTIAMTGCAVNTSSIESALPSTAASLAEPAPTISADPFAPREGETGGETDRILDEDTLRLAVTTADLDASGANVVPWANAATGSSGRISAITQYQKDGQICRAFDATRQAYDGTFLYNGEVCLDRRSGWWTRKLEKAG